MIKKNEMKTAPKSPKPVLMKTLWLKEEFTDLEEERDEKS